MIDFIISKNGSADNSILIIIAIATTFPINIFIMLIYYVNEIIRYHAEQ